MASFAAASTAAITRPALLGYKQVTTARRTVKGSASSGVREFPMSITVDPATHCTCLTPGIVGQMPS
jgi:hypothetical protein